MSGDANGDQGVTVFGTSWYAGFNQVDVGDYVSVTGVSSVWKPGGSSGAYRCVWTSAAVTATVVDSDRAPIDGVTVTLYGVACDSGTAKVEATDDSAPVDGDHPDDDPYGYDWEQLHDKYGSPTTIYIYPPTTSLTLAADPEKIGTCGGDTSAITADLRMCGSAVADVDVTFTTTHGVFDETGTTSATATTNGSGIATVHLRASTNDPGTASISASAAVYGIPVSSGTSLKVEMLRDKLTLTAGPYSVPPSESSSAITAKLTTPSGAAASAARAEQPCILGAGK